MFDREGRYLMTDYHGIPPFSSFLPGIAGPMGIPVWCYYNNRGQAVCSFGAQDKDHAILEFCPANTAYRDVSRTGFRTFCKIDGEFEELFTKNCDMYIGMSELELASKGNGLEASVCYFGIPEERTAALARILTVRNMRETDAMLEILDGLAAIVPYGVDQDVLKNMSNLAVAWMQAEDYKEGLSYFRTRASMEDTARVTKVEGGNFCIAVDQAGKRIAPIVQTRLVFGEDTSLAVPRGFLQQGIGELCTVEQIAQNQFPCCFIPMKRRLKPGECLTIYSIYGQAEEKGQVLALAEKICGGEWFCRKRGRAKELVDDLCAAVSTKTANPVFDAYCRQTYLDNLLRGGSPMFFRYKGVSKPYYIYSRKHGDPEREYNYFSLGKEYYAQGNGNYRDVNQNRRCDVLFAPELGTTNIHTFYDLIQTDGYNPLVLNAATYMLTEETRKAFAVQYPVLEKLLGKPFTPGALSMKLEDAGVDPEKNMEITAEIICAAQNEPNADFKEGYWCDHWTYNLDLIESYLTIYPEQKDNLLFCDRSYRYYNAKVMVNPRQKRYVWTEEGLRQYHALDEKAKGGVSGKWMCTADGQEARSTLAEKLLLLCAIKAATLDAAGMGIEMEGGRPGWYDALNGLPGLFGSSIPESCELARLLDFTAGAFREHGTETECYQEIWELVVGVRACLAMDGLYERWNELNRLKEEYRLKTLGGYRGERIHLMCGDVSEILEEMGVVVREGIDRAKGFGRGVIPTYFSFEAQEVEDTLEGPMPRDLKPQALPLFLEGPVHLLKLNDSRESKRDLADAIRHSLLYDEKLHMYKVNASLEGVSYEAGRAKAFTSGWLENESIWLHMEYKYLLELLKAGLYEEFSQAFHDAAIPFLSPEVYGRCPTENVSFLASSVNPDENVHGRGFVARLSGSTVEFLQMWQIMFFGEKPFSVREGRLSLEFSPFIPAYLMPEDGIVEAAFLGKITVVYHAKGALEPGKTRAKSYILVYADGSRENIQGRYLSERYAKEVREGYIRTIIVEMEDYI